MNKNFVYTTKYFKIVQAIQKKGYNTVLVPTQYKNFITDLYMKYMLNKFTRPFYPSLKQETLYGIFKFSSSSIPHPNKIEKGGEDASYESKSLLVVADGVGGWNQMGIDPSEYSKNICYLVQKFAKEYEHHYNQDINQSNKYHDKPVVINESTVKNWIIKSVLKNKKKGSSTICVVYLDKISKMLFSSYIGDSSYMIARPQEIGKFSLVFKSEEQSHGFNIPYQVGTDGDKPYCAISQSHKIEKNDIVLLATDGLWDNVDSEDIIHLLNEFSKKENSIEIDINEFVINISSVAKTRSQDKQFISPFAKKALEYNRRYIGGKPDDITVVGAQIDFTGEDTLDDHHLSRTMDETCDSDLETTRSKSDI